MEIIGKFIWWMVLSIVGIIFIVILLTMLFKIIKAIVKDSDEY